MLNRESKFGALLYMNFKHLWFKVVLIRDNAWFTDIPASRYKAMQTGTQVEIA